MAFIENEWYVAALKSEVGEELFSRTILGRAVVFYRTAAGKPVAFRDRCIHRGYPLSRGKRIGDTIQCGYHGVTFDADGSCVFVPGQSAIPPKVRAANFPVVDFGPFVWIWMGDPDRATETPLSSAPGFSDPRFHFVHGYAPIGCNYILVIDNLLDLSHETYIHASRIGTAEVAETPITAHIARDQGWLVKVRRHMLDAACPPLWREMTGLESPIDRTQDISYYAPALYVLNNRVARAGYNREGAEDDSEAFRTRVVYMVTPESENRTHYFFAIGRDHRKDEEGVDAKRIKGQRAVILEDADAVELLQRVADEDGVFPEVNIKLDAWGLAARRLISERLGSEHLVRSGSSGGLAPGQTDDAVSPSTQ